MKEGGFSYSDCYSMPISLRKRYVKRLEKWWADYNKKTTTSGNNMNLEDLASKDALKKLDPIIPNVVTKGTPPAKK